MDPQCRLLLEQTTAALTHASSSMGSLADTRTGVYVGCMWPADYIHLLGTCGQKAGPNITTGNGSSFLTGRLSYTFGLQVGIYTCLHVNFKFMP